MTRDRVREHARQRAHEIEESYADNHVPQPVMAVYVLLRAIAHGNLNSYVQEFGPLTIARHQAEQGKVELGWGQLTAFEIDCIAAVNRFVERLRPPHLVRSHQFR